jgi:hypothetical protein
MSAVTYSCNGLQPRLVLVVLFEQCPDVLNGSQNYDQRRTCHSYHEQDFDGANTSGQHDVFASPLPVNRKIYKKVVKIWELRVLPDLEVGTQVLSGLQDFGAC